MGMVFVLSNIEEIIISIVMNCFVLILFIYSDLIDIFVLL